MNQLLRSLVLVLVVFTLASESDAGFVTSVGSSSATIEIVSVVATNGDPASTVGLAIFSDPYEFFDNPSSGAGFAMASAEAIGGTDPDALGIGDTVAIGNSIDFELSGPGESTPFAYSTVAMLISNGTGADITINFMADYQLNLSLSSWTDPGTMAIVYGDLEISYAITDDEIVVLSLIHISEPTRPY